MMFFSFIYAAETSDITLASETIFTDRTLLVESVLISEEVGRVESNAIFANARYGFVQKGNPSGICERNARRLAGKAPGEERFLARFFMIHGNIKVGYIAPGFYGVYYHVHFAISRALLNMRLFCAGLQCTLDAIPEGGVPGKNQEFLLSLSPQDPCCQLADQLGFTGNLKMNTEGTPYRDADSLKFIADNLASLTGQSEDGSEGRSREELEVSCQRMIYTIPLERLRAELHARSVAAGAQ